jgi:hypothetical protein
MFARQSERHYKIALELSHDDVVALWNYGVLLEKMGEAEEAEEYQVRLNAVCAIQARAEPRIFELKICHLPPQ